LSTVFTFANATDPTFFRTVSGIALLHSGTAVERL
jgi:hypothetical protein